MNITTQQSEKLFEFVQRIGTLHPNRIKPGDLIKEARRLANEIQPMELFKKGDKVVTPNGRMEVYFIRHEMAGSTKIIIYHCVPLTKTGTLDTRKVRQSEWNPRCRFTADQLRLMTCK